MSDQKNSINPNKIERLIITVEREAVCKLQKNGTSACTCGSGVL